MTFKTKSAKHALGIFLLWAVSYQIIWHITFLYIFHYQYAVTHGNKIVFIKLLGELLLYAIFSVRFANLKAQVSNVSKWLLVSLTLLLLVLTFYASIETL